MQLSSLWQVQDFLAKWSLLCPLPAITYPCEYVLSFNIEFKILNAAHTMDREDSGLEAFESNVGAIIEPEN